jgi:hypothetical protein
MQTESQTQIISRENMIADVSILFHNAPMPTLKEPFTINPLEEEDSPRQTPFLGLQRQYNLNGRQGAMGEVQPVPEPESEPVPEPEPEPVYEPVPVIDPYQFELFPENTELKFGTITLKIAEFPIIKQEIVVDSNIDNSSSMDQRTADNQRKIAHAQLTYRNIADVLAKSSEASVTLSIHSFDHIVEEILPDTKVTLENIASIKGKINQIEPRGSTDIGLAVKTQKNRIDARPKTTRQVAITLTDGNITSGEKDYNKIKTDVDENAWKYYIGLGPDHDAKGLQTLADVQQRGKYYYIAEGERAYIAFGEILAEILYTGLENVTLEAKEGEFFNYKTGSWESSISVDTFTSQQTRTFHIRSANPENFSVNVLGQSLVHDDPEPVLLVEDETPVPYLLSDGVVEVVDLTLFILRQKVQELIALKREHDSGLKEHTMTISQVKKEMTNLVTFLEKFRAENEEYVGNEIYQTLLDDLNIILKTFESRRSYLYTTARWSSQGEQRSHNMNTIEKQDLTLQNPVLRRQHAVFVGGNDGFSEASGVSKPTLGRAYTSENTTPSQAAMMRALSEGSANNDFVLVEESQEEVKEN